MQEKTFNRWLVVVGACLLQAVLGSVYAWSLFTSSLAKQLMVSPGQVAFTFSVTMSAFTIGVLIAGKAQDKFKPQKIAMVGGIVAGIGVLLASMASSIMHIYLTYGIITGFAMGAVYVVPVATCVKWFPEKRGLVTGLNLAFVGVGTMAVKPVVVWLSNTQESFGSPFISWGLAMAYSSYSPRFSWYSPLLVMFQRDIRHLRVLRVKRYVSILFLR